ncbi:DUF3768 domain-containing protein [Methylobacterium sp. R2-1]|uniref:DUF3768 domain-containing protein n=1 Tax=Methylobacterium sp. R2-1 TaxID=2587064 RepID=UPI0016134B20|nr:DUF3768 domain-containing protein [Methylobacterium sp. R2-1]MBB2962536.1 hypothetical protein [Methylobacterium sp. R2-1]
MAVPSVAAHSHQVRDLNDAFRRSFSSGRVVLTAGVVALPEATRTSLLAMVRDFDAFDAFDADNDPHREHDFGEVASGEVRAFWKIDAYDRTLTFASPDSTDPAVTVRVLTVMLAEEY